MDQYSDHQKLEQPDAGVKLMKVLEVVRYTSRGVRSSVTDCSSLVLARLGATILSLVRVAQTLLTHLLSF